MLGIASTCPNVGLQVLAVTA